MPQNFDPDKFLAETAKPSKQKAFDPDRFLAETSPESKVDARPKMAVGESALAGAAQGATLGFADEITAGMGALKDWGAAKLGLRGDIGLGEAYQTHIRPARAKYEAAQADNPKAYTAGAIGGGVATSLLPGAISARAGQAMNTVKGGAAIGALTGAGTSEASLTESPSSLSQFAKDVGMGAAVGGGSAAAFKALGKGLNSLKPENLEKFANVKTLKAAGYMGPDLKKLSEAQKQDIGQRLYEKGVVKFGDSLDEVLEKASASKEESGRAIGAALENVDTLVDRAKSMIDSGMVAKELPEAGKAALKDSIDKQLKFNMSRIGGRIQEEIIAPNLKNPLLKGEMAKLTDLSEDFVKGGRLTLKEGNVIKGTQGKVTNFNSDTVPQAFKQEVYDIIKTELDDIVAKTGNLESFVAQGADQIGVASPKSLDIESRNRMISEAYKEAKKDYAALINTEKVAAKRLGQTQANREVSLTDTIAGAGALAAGGPTNAMVVGGLNKLMRTYGDTAAASGARTAAKIIASTPEKLGSFGNLLAESAKRGGVALNATHLSLMKNPDYQRILADYERQQTPTGRRASRIERGE